MYGTHFICQILPHLTLFPSSGCHICNYFNLDFAINWRPPYHKVIILNTNLNFGITTVLEFHLEHRRLGRRLLSLWVWQGFVKGEVFCFRYCDFYFSTKANQGLVKEEKFSFRSLDFYFDMERVLLEPGKNVKIWTKFLSFYKTLKWELMPYLMVDTSLVLILFSLTKDFLSKLLEIRALITAINSH